MGKTIPTQRLITVKGAGNSTTPIVQAAGMWIDGRDFKDVAIDVLVLQNTAAVSNASLVLETAMSSEGPWTAIATFGAGYCKTIKYFTSREGGTDKFERFIRYKIDRSGGTLSDWTLCFKLCATLKE